MLKVQSQKEVPSKVFKFKGLNSFEISSNSPFLLGLHSLQLKNSTDKLILKILLEEGPKTRSNLVQQTSIPRTTVFDALSRLSVLGIIEELSLNQKGKKGRPSKIFQIKNSLNTSFLSYSKVNDGSFKNLGLIIGVLNTHELYILGFHDLEFLGVSTDITCILNRQIPIIEAIIHISQDVIHGFYGPLPVIGHPNLFFSIFIKFNDQKSQNNITLLIIFFDREIEQLLPARKELETQLDEIMSDYLSNTKLDSLYLAELKARIIQKSLEIHYLR